MFKLDHFHSLVNTTNFTIIPTKRELPILFVLLTSIWSNVKNGHNLIQTNYFNYFIMKFC